MFNHLYSIIKCKKEERTAFLFLFLTNNINIFVGNVTWYKQILDLWSSGKWSEKQRKKTEYIKNKNKKQIWRLMKCKLNKRYLIICSKSVVGSTSMRCGEGIKIQVYDLWDQLRY